MTHSHKEPQDSEIISRILGGDVNAFELLVERYKSLIFGIVMKHVPYDRVEDVAQDSFLEIFRSLGSYAAKSPFSHWLSKITVRCCYDFWRQHRSNHEQVLSSLSEDSQQWLDTVMAGRSRENFEQEASGREAREILSHALGHLSAKDRVVLTLVHLEGRSVKETSDLLGWSQISVKVRAHRSRSKLRKVISDLLDGRQERE